MAEPAELQPLNTQPPTLQDPAEQAVLDRLLEIREELLLLKQDKSTYVKGSDVMALYDKTVEQIRILNELRAQPPEKETRGWFSCIIFIVSDIDDDSQEANSEQSTESLTTASSSSPFSS